MNDVCDKQTFVKVVCIHSQSHLCICSRRPDICSSQRDDVCATLADYLQSRLPHGRTGCSRSRHRPGCTTLFSRCCTRWGGGSLCRCGTLHRTWRRLRRECGRSCRGWRCATMMFAGSFGCVVCMYVCLSVCLSVCHVRSFAS